MICTNVPGRRVRPRRNPESFSTVSREIEPVGLVERLASTESHSPLVEVFPVFRPGF